MLLGAGRLKNFRACCASVKRVPKKGLIIDRQTADLLEVQVGDPLVAVAR
jgi:arginine N-succinyltransferase